MRGVKWDADAQDISLLDSLIAIARAKATDIRDGSVVQSTSLGGGSVTFAFPQQLDPMKVAMVASTLIDMYEEVSTDLGEGATDDAIFSAMMLRLKSHGRITANLTNLCI